MSLRQILGWLEITVSAGRNRVSPCGSVDVKAEQAR